jgi:hypothetical protein
MRKLIILSYFAIVLLMVSCQESQAFATIMLSTTPVPTGLNTPTLIFPSATPTRLPTETGTSTLAPTATTAPTDITPTFLPEAHLQSQCIEIVPTLHSKSISNGIVVLYSRVIIDGKYKDETLLLNMETGESILTGPGGNFMVSPDRKRVAYIFAVFDDQDNVIQKYLIIADANGRIYLDGQITNI